MTGASVVVGAGVFVGCAVVDGSALDGRAVGQSTGVMLRARLKRPPPGDGITVFRCRAGFVCAVGGSAAAG